MARNKNSTPRGKSKPPKLTVVPAPQPVASAAQQTPAMPREKGYLLVETHDGRLVKMPPARAARLFLAAGYHMIAVFATLYVYERGVYRPGGEQVVARWAQRGYADLYKERDSKEVIHWLLVHCRVEQSELDTGALINVENGLLDWRTGKLLPHDYSHLSIVQLPTRWEPNAYHQRGDKFLDEVLPDAATRRVIEEFIGYGLLPDCRHQLALLCVGIGANGKSVLLRWIGDMLGKANLSALSLQHVGERFRTAELAGKLANVFADLPRVAVTDTSAFKALVAGDEFTAERKYKDPFVFTNRAKLIFSANALPDTPDISEAYFRRWVIVPFPKKFTKKTPGFDRNLIRKLTSQPGRSYLLRLAVEGLRRLERRGYFTETPATRAAIADYRQRTDSVAAFIGEKYEYIGGKVCIPKPALYKAYVAWCMAPTHGAEPIAAVSESEFATRLRTIEPRVVDARPRCGGERPRVWVGLRSRRRRGR